MGCIDKLNKLLKNGWTTQSIANELGVSKTTISRWVRGLQDPSPAAEKVLNNKLDFLLEGSTNKALCPNCYEHLVLDVSHMLTSNPPKYEIYCEGCGYRGYIQCSESYGYEWKKVEDKINHISDSKVVDWTIDGIKLQDIPTVVDLKVKDGEDVGIDSSLYDHLTCEHCGKRFYTIGDYFDHKNHCKECHEYKKCLDKEIAELEQQLANLKAQKEKEKWQFTEDEKVILRNLPEEYRWIARDKDDHLWIYRRKPEKSSSCGEWHCFDEIVIHEINEFSHLFQCIQWEDDEPCEFRKFI